MLSLDFCVLSRKQYLWLVDYQPCANQRNPPKTNVTATETLKICCSEKRKWLLR